MSSKYDSAAKISTALTYSRLALTVAWDTSLVGREPSTARGDDSALIWDGRLPEGRMGGWYECKGAGVLMFAAFARLADLRFPVVGASTSMGTPGAGSRQQVDAGGCGSGLPGGA